MIRTYLRIFVYGVYIPLSLIFGYYAVPPAYTHYRSEFLAQMNRVYEKDQARKTEVAMLDLGNRKLPAMPALKELK